MHLKIVITKDMPEKYIPSPSSRYPFQECAACFPSLPSGLALTVRPAGLAEVPGVNGAP